MNAEQYWQLYLSTLPPEHPHHQATYSAWGFGDHPALKDELGYLVKQGIKSATASVDWDDDPIPFVGELSIILDGQDHPLCIIETLEVRNVPFNEVDAQFAYDEGEGDRSLDYWRDAHRRYFNRVGQSSGHTLTETTPIICERFKVIFAI